MKKIFVLVITILMAFSIVSCSNNTDKEISEKQVDVAPSVEEVIDDNLTVEELVVEKTMVDEFIEKYNSTSPTPITDAVEVDVTDKASGHYRTEFRLGAFENSIAKTGKIGNTVVDVVNCGWQNDELRIYVDGINGVQAAEIVQYAAPIMDADISNEELQDVLNYLIGKNDYHNGYFGELCMTFNDIRGELMLRTD